MLHVHLNPWRSVSPRLFDSRGFAIALLILMTFAPRAGAAAKVWDGSSNGNWGTAANWSGGTAPNAGDDLVFPHGVGGFIDIFLRRKDYPRALAEHAND